MRLVRFGGPHIWSGANRSAAAAVWHVGGSGGETAAFGLTAEFGTLAYHMRAVSRMHAAGNKEMRCVSTDGCRADTGTRELIDLLSAANLRLIAVYVCARLCACSKRRLYTHSHKTTFDLFALEGDNKARLGRTGPSASVRRAAGLYI